MIYHEWVVRGRCECGYLWTTPGSPSVVCACGHCAIVDNVPSQDVLPVTDEVEFKTAVAQDLSEPPENVTLIQVT